jgi:cytochrome c biogenesis protein CcmG, thiol:disulfide interchange protein DsbE
MRRPARQTRPEATPARTAALRPLLKLLAATALMAACTADTDAYRPLQPGDPAPDFSAADLAGDTLRLSALAGPVLLNVWATWCPPCREEMPALQELHERFSDRGLHVVGVTIDGARDGNAVQRFLNELGITFLILHDPADRVSRLFRTSGVPETFLIDRGGRIVHRWIGRFDPMAPDVIERVEDALAATE